jgi:replicative DNA helicase
MKDDRKLEIKSRMAEYLQSKGIDVSKHFLCLVHEDHKPSMSFKNNRIKCFSCGWSGDIFDLIGLEYGLKDYKEVFKKAESLFESAQLPSEARKPSTQYQDIPKQKKNYTAYFRRVQSQLRQTDYLLKRGVSYETAERYGVGFDPNFRFSMNGPTTPAIILFTGQHSFTVRNTLPQVGEVDRVRKIGGCPLYLGGMLSKADRPLIVTEGEIDALSVWEAGGCAMALGTTNNDELFVKRVAELKPSIRLVLSLDNDESGRAATVRIASELSALNIDFTVCNISGEYNDPSEALQFNREAFTKAVREIYSGK